jgi:DNA-binding NarL/FixJ family response regulator
MKEGIVIMIVDDNVNFVSRMKGLLESLDGISSINVAGDHDSAVRLLIEQTPDFLLLDINLPGKNGMEILKFVKDKNLECEVIMITNHADEYYRSQCKRSGAKYFLDKSSEFRLVTEIISRKAIINP